MGNLITRTTTESEKTTELTDIAEINTTTKTITTDQYLANTKQNTIAKLNEYGLNHDLFMKELTKYNGVISGSFMFMNFFNKPMECNDIDIYVNDNEYFNKMYEYTTSFDLQNNLFHPFENYILNNITHKYRTKNSYYFIDGILYSRLYIYDKININFILLKDSCKTYINNNFDLDCCKIIYDGDNVQVFDIESLINRKSMARYNKCSLDNIYQGKPLHGGFDRTILFQPDYCTLKNSVPCIKLKMLYDVYLFNKKKITEFPNYEHNECINNENEINSEITNEKFNGHSYIDLYTKFIDEINKTISLDVLFCHESWMIAKKIKLTDNIVKVISMIRTLERIEKYKKRGMKEITLVIDN